MPLVLITNIVPLDGTVIKDESGSDTVYNGIYTEVIDSQSEIFPISKFNYSMATKILVLKEIRKSKFIYSNNQKRYHLYEDDMETSPVNKIFSYGFHP